MIDLSERLFVLLIVFPLILAGSAVGFVWCCLRGGWNDGCASYAGMVAKWPGGSGSFRGEPQR